jgi:hypothetical protein
MEFGLSARAPALRYRVVGRSPAPAVAHRGAITALIIFAALSRARGGRRFQRALRQTDLHRPAGWRCRCWPTSTFHFCGIVVRRFGGDDGARAIGADADVGFAWLGRRRWCRRRSRAGRYGVIGNDRQILQHRQWGHPLRARERRAPIPASCETELRRADRPASRLCGCWRRRHFRFSGIVVRRFWFGATMEVGRSMMSAGAGAARATGSSTTDRKICSTDSGSGEAPISTRTCGCGSITST